MTEIHAKPIVDGKFWIVEDQGNKVGILKITEQKKYVFSSKDKITTFDNKKKLFETFGKDFFVAKTSTPEKEIEKSVHDYPTSSIPHNPLYEPQCYCFLQYAHCWFRWQEPLPQQAWWHWSWCRELRCRQRAGANKHCNWCLRYWGCLQSKYLC